MSEKSAVNLFGIPSDETASMKAALGDSESIGSESTYRVDELLRLAFVISDGGERQVGTTDALRNHLVSTADQVIEILDQRLTPGIDAAEQSHAAVRAEASRIPDDRVAEIRRAMRNLGSDNYGLKMMDMADMDCVERGSVGLVVSGIAAWRNSIIRDVKLKVKSPISGFIGVPGEWIMDVHVTITSVQGRRVWKKSLVLFRTDDGNVIKAYIGDLVDYPLTVGGRCLLTANVKSHSHFRGMDETVVVDARLSPTEDAPHAALVEILQLLTPPRRRRVTAMAHFFEVLEVGRTIQVVMSCPVFGVYSLTGRARFSEVAGGFCIGSTILTLGYQPEKSVLAVGAVGLSFSPSSADLQQEVERVRHGDLVSAFFQSRDTGEDIHLVGPAVESTARLMMGVGQWILRRRGGVAPALRSLEVLAGPAPISVICPAPVRSWAESDDPVGGLHADR